jgi:hypothetical protein
MRSTIVEPAARAMGKPERVAYLRSRGWRHRIECGGAQSWEPPGTAPHEASFTLAAAIRAQLICDYRASLPAVRGIPVVPVKRAGTWQGVTSWLIDCPYCGREHSHSAAPGHRVAHCGSGVLVTGDRGVGYYIEHPADDDGTVCRAERCTYIDAGAAPRRG